MSSFSLSVVDLATQFVTPCYTLGMASTYTRPNSPFISIRYKEGGKWKSRATQYRKGNLGDERQAKLAAREMSLVEAKQKPVSSSEMFSEWVPRWLADTYPATKHTFTVYSRHWNRLSTFLSERSISTPRQFTYRHIPEYVDWRTKSAGKNTAIHELKFMGVIMNEAVRREFAERNPCVRMGLKKDEAKEKSVWSDEEISAVSAAIHTQPHWLRCTFVLGLYQAARLRQVPRLSGIDFSRMQITYHTTKGNKPFTHPMDERAKPLLEQLVAERKTQDPKAVTLCDIPVNYPPSLVWREFLTSLGLDHLSHHGLRVTWITRAAVAGVHMSLAKRFVNHGSTAVHEIYQKLSVSDIEGVPIKVQLPALVG